MNELEKLVMLNVGVSVLIKSALLKSFKQQQEPAAKIT